MSEQLKKQERDISQLTNDGQTYVHELESILCKALKLRSLKSVKLDAKQRKGESLMKRLIGFDKNKTTQVSLSQEQLLLNQQEQLKADMDL